MKKIFTIALLLFFVTARALDPNHFTITRITAPYFVVDGNSPATITKAYVGFEVRNNSNSGVTYSGLKFTITSINTTVVGQNYSIVSPANGIQNAGTLAPGESRVCYFYIGYPASTTPQGTFNIQLTDNTAGSKTQGFLIRNRSSISANAGGTATQTISNQDLIGATVIDDVTYVVGNVQNGDENDFQVAVSSQFDPTKVSLLSTSVIASTVPGINVGSTDSLFFITGNGSNGATITIRWIFRITGFNFTTYLLPCAGATSGATNYKYALNTALGSGTAVTVSSAANPLTITKTSDQSLYGINSTATFTVTITNPGAYGVTIDKITDEIPAGFSFLAIDATSAVNASNSTSVPANGATGTIAFEGGVTTGVNTSYYIAAGGSIVLKYTATTASATALNLQTSVKDYIGTTEVGSALNTVSVSATLPVGFVSFRASRGNQNIKLDWTALHEPGMIQFDLERSEGNEPYHQIGTVMVSNFIGGNISSTFTDFFPGNGSNHYRVKMTGADQHFVYSQVVSVNPGLTSTGINVYPNPFSSNTNISISLNKDEPVVLELYDMKGILLIKKEFTGSKGINTLSIEKLGSIQPGTYLLKVNTSAENYQQRIIKK